VSVGIRVGFSFGGANLQEAPGCGTNQERRDIVLLLVTHRR